MVGSSRRGAHSLATHGAQQLRQRHVWGQPSGPAPGDDAGAGDAARGDRPRTCDDPRWGDSGGRLGAWPRGEGARRVLDRGGPDDAIVYLSGYGAQSSQANRPHPTRITTQMAQSQIAPPVLPIVEGMTRSAAFFDLDKTIIARSSSLAFSRPFYASGLINRRTVLRSGVRPVRLPRRRRRPRPDGADAAVPQSMVAGWAVAQVREVVAETLHELDRPDRLRRGRDVDRGAPRGGPRHRHRQLLRSRGGRADRRRCSAPTASSPPAW